MKFVLFRHAQKNITPFEDPELSTSGLEQAARIARMVESNILPRPTRLLVSSKKRTSQTFSSTAQKFKLDCEIDESLDMRHSFETAVDFRKRIQKFLDSLSINSNNQNVIFACTHYDWIEESMTLIECDKDLSGFEFSHWSPTQYVVFEIQNGNWTYVSKGDAK